MPNASPPNILSEKRARTMRIATGVVMALAAFVIATSAHAQSCTVPQGATRANILNVVRAPVAGDLGGLIEFKVERARLCGPFAFVVATPQRPGGAEIHWKGTPCEGDTSHLVGALLRQRGGVWKLLDYALCPADVAWVDWPEKYKAPAILFEE